MAVRQLGSWLRAGRSDVHLIATAKLNSVDSQAWLASVLRRIAGVWLRGFTNSPVASAIYPRRKPLDRDRLR